LYSSQNALDRGTYTFGKHTPSGDNLLSSKAFLAAARI